MRCGVPLLFVGVLALAACGVDGRATSTSTSTSTSTLPVTDAAAGPATDETVDPDARDLDAARAVASTSTAPPRPAPTDPSTTVGLTTVETLAPPVLPVPAPAPPPRADEPYVELGTIEIPRIGVTEALLEGITLNTLDLGPGHWPGTAMPGQLGNAVIAGHRTSHEKPFRHIDQLEVGDEVIFTTAAGRFAYAVTGTTIVAPDAMYIIEQTPAATATLFACHPPGSTRQRIVVSLALQQ